MEEKLLHDETIHSYRNRSAGTHHGDGSGQQGAQGHGKVIRISPPIARSRDKNRHSEGINCAEIPQNAGFYPVSARKREKHLAFCSFFLIFASLTLKEHT